MQSMSLVGSQLHDESVSSTTGRAGRALPLLRLGDRNGAILMVMEWERGMMSGCGCVVSEIGGGPGVGEVVFVPGPGTLCWSCRGECLIPWTSGTWMSVRLGRPGIRRGLMRFVAATRMPQMATAMLIRKTRMEARIGFVRNMVGGRIVVLLMAVCRCLWSASC